MGLNWIIVSEYTFIHIHLINIVRFVCSTVLINSISIFKSIILYLLILQTQYYKIKWYWPPRNIDLLNQFIENKFPLSFPIHRLRTATSQRFQMPFVQLAVHAMQLWTSTKPSGTQIYIAIHCGSKTIAIIGGKSFIHLSLL